MNLIKLEALTLNAQERKNITPRIEVEIVLKQD